MVIFFYLNRIRNPQNEFEDCTECGGKFFFKRRYLLNFNIMKKRGKNGKRLGTSEDRVN